MIASAKADGQVDGNEQATIMEALKKSELSEQAQSEVMMALMNGVILEDIISGEESMAEKSELYLASCLAIDLDSVQERQHLDALAEQMSMPKALTLEIEQQYQKNQLALEEVK
jgi:uncharacterized membrane protein YebE (DUF533 family)